MQKHEKNPFSTMSGIARKGTVATLCLIMAGLFFVAGCKKDNPTEITGGGEEPEYPVEVPFEEYGLTEVCQWENLSYDDKVIIINSEEELQQYVACTDGSYPAVDFSVHTLLLVNGRTTNGISEIKKNLRQLSVVEYELNIEITLNAAAVAEAWTVAIIVEKISEKSTVELVVTEDSSEYIPLLEHGNQWNELSEYYGCEDLRRTYITKTGSDTLIDDVNYYKLLMTKDELAEIWMENGCIREDVENRKVYYKPYDKPEMLLYDFNAQVGDEIQSHAVQFVEEDVVIKVEAVNYVFIGGKMRKQMSVCSSSILHDRVYKSNHVWIEGIGNMNGFLRSTVAVQPNGTDNIELLCFFQNEELVYKPENTDITDCFVWRYKFENIQFIKDDNISFYPNPVDNILTVSSSSNTISRVEIFDNAGRKIYSQSYENNIDVSSFPRGLYLLKIYDTGGQSSLFKIIKK